MSSFLKTISAPRSRIASVGLLFALILHPVSAEKQEAVPARYLQEAVEYPAGDTVSFRNTSSEKKEEGDEIDREILGYFQNLPESEDQDLDRQRIEEIFGLNPPEEALTDLSEVEEMQPAGDPAKPEENLESETEQNESEESGEIRFANVSDDESGIVSHQVIKGDTIWGISRKYSVRPEDILKHNPELRNRPLYIGETIMVKTNRPSSPPAPRVHVRYHTVVRGDTLSEIARNYNVTLSALMSWNRLGQSSVIHPGDRIKIVYRRKGPPPGYEYAPYFIWPVKGRITSWFGRRRNPFLRSTRHFHKGLDISANLGTPVKAARDGIVIMEGRMGGYGNAVFLRHANGYVTIYAHCKLNLVKKGDAIKQGQVIAEVGRTGTATGPHLHFEIRKMEKPINPVAALKMQEVVPRNGSSSQTAARVP